MEDSLALKFLALAEDRRRRMTSYDIPAQFRDLQARLLLEFHTIYGAERGMNLSKSAHPDGFSFFVTVIEAIVARRPGPCRYLEVGSFEGVSMSVVGSLLQMHGAAGTLTSIDAYYDEGYTEHHPLSGAVKSSSTIRTMQQAHRLYSALGLEVEQIRSESKSALIDLLKAGREFDMVYIDGLHRGLTPTIDFSLANCLLSKNGVVVIDDWPWEDVRGLKRLCDNSLEMIAECPDIAAYWSKQS